MKVNNTSNTKAFAAAGFLVLLLLLALGYGVAEQQAESIQNAINANPIIPQIIFQFDVYCPVDSDSKLAMINQALGFTTKAIDIDFSKNKNFYIVIAKTQPSNSSQPSSPGGLYYCGLARKWWELNCNRAQVICSIPGPMFYFPIKQEATIMFINDINAETVNWVQSDCYHPDSDDQICTVTQKEKSDKCTYFHPTDYILQNTLRHRVNQTSVPISPHIHGLQIRPTFDGNPLSWFNTAGEKGPGYNSLTNAQYYSLFNNPTTFDGLISVDSQISKRSKTIKVTNDQLPGMLFYHDHAMKSTLFNVQNGFSGLYIIYDKSVEAKLPNGANEKLVVFAKQGDARIFVSQNGLMDSSQSAGPGNYRIRMLNAHFDDVFYNVSYSAYYETVEQPDGTSTYIQYDPTSSPQFDFTAHQHKIPFTIIGADTSMYRDPLSGIDQVNLGSAERVDILINFQDSLPQGIQFVYIVCYDNNQGKYVMKHRFSLPWTGKTASINTLNNKLKTQNEKNIAVVSEEQNPIVSDPQYIKSLKLSVPFTDLSTIPQSAIAVKRHRPLFSLPRDGRFMIGAHYMFEMGASQNIQIGTYQDLYIVNTLWQAHPIHVHLINFQTILSYSLKQLPQNPQCTFYMLDFFRLSGLPQFQKNNSQLCSYIWNMQDDQVLRVFQQMNSYMREDIIGSDKNSGLNSLTPFDGNSDYLVDGCPFNTVYKYVCANTTDTIEPYRRKWKDTTLVPPYTVYVIRIRWASTSYDPSVSEYPYFSIPEDQLMQFPGFVYHCHILPHQDNQMMRPIMLKPSALYLKQWSSSKPNGSCSGGSWQQTMRCINERVGCPA